MAEVRLDPERVTVDGLSASYTSINSTDTYKVVNDGRVIIHVKNDDASDETVTITTPQTIGTDQLSVEDPTVTVSASGDQFIGPFAPGTYNSGGDVQFSFSNGTSTTVGVLKIR